MSELTNLETLANEGLAIATTVDPTLAPVVGAVSAVEGVASTVEADVAAHKSALVTAQDSATKALESAPAAIAALPENDAKVATGLLAKIEDAIPSIEKLFSLFG